MSFGTKHAKDKLSSRLTRVYAELFAAVLFLLTLLVFILAWRFLTDRQTENLRTILELTGDHILEEMEEGESITDPDVLAEQNTNGNLSFYMQDESGKIINRLLNFPLNEKDFQSASAVPKLILDKDGRMLLCCAQNIQEGGRFYGRLTMVQNLETEQAFLKMLGLLLLYANGIGVCAALLVGKLTGRKMLAPIHRMIEEAKQIDEKNLNQRLEVPEPDDELRALAQTVNGMLDRVSAAYSQQGRFVADVSHELRTPLAVMQGNVDLLGRWGGEDEAVRRECIEAIDRQTVYMAKLVENLLFLARCDDSRQAMKVTAFSVKEVFDELLEEQALVDTLHTYERQLEDDALLVTGDRAMIKQLLRALMDNSVKYTPPGGRIGLACYRQGSAVCFTVSDNGCGMSKEHLSHVFERFYRVDKARTRATGGMGLGLSIVLAIAQAHGGVVRAESEPAKGTVITVTLPQKVTSGEEAPKENA